MVEGADEVEVTIEATIGDEVEVEVTIDASRGVLFGFAGRELFDEVEADGGSALASAASR